MKKAFSTFLVTSIVCSLMISASAFESKNISEVDTSNVIGYEYIISYSEEEIVGSINDAVFENSGSSSEMTSVNSTSSKDIGIRETIQVLTNFHAYPMLQRSYDKRKLLRHRVERITQKESIDRTVLVIPN